MGPAQTENKQTGMEKNNINNNRLDPKTKSKREKIQKKRATDHLQLTIGS